MSSAATWPMRIPAAICCSRASRFVSRRGARSAWSAPTGSARAPCSASSPATWRPRRASCRSTAGWRTCPRTSASWASRGRCASCCWDWRPARCGRPGRGWRRPSSASPAVTTTPASTWRPRSATGRRSAATSWRASGTPPVAGSSARASRSSPNGPRRRCRGASASGWCSTCCSHPTPTSCCSTSPTTSSTSRPSARSSSRSRPPRRPSPSSRTIASCWPPQCRRFSRSRVTAPGRTRAPTRPTRGRARSASASSATRSSAGRRRSAGCSRS
jgi:hypothetical protein